ncbi:hypothetical protein C2845_PM06G25500 [Panicum miliaceum]|uniref:Uncharacterized protein n=1 Tax=Panicum miliaceum TaxID=4540 RepID=A0A3L6RE97_PANMI|nr:hypothetical protein C2845_PM06G25500 [Panicum miliaceum]
MHGTYAKATGMGHAINDATVAFGSPPPPPSGSGGLCHLYCSPPPPPDANLFGPEAPAASTAHQGPSAARLWRRPRRLRSAVSSASTAGRRAAPSSFYSRPWRRRISLQAPGHSRSSAASTPSPGAGRTAHLPASIAEGYDGGGIMTIWLHAGRRARGPRAARRRPGGRGPHRTFLDTWRTGGHADNSIVFLPPRGKWRALRRFATAELFAPRRLDARRPLRQEKARELVRRVSERAGRGEPVDVRDAAFDAGMDMLSRTLFSVDLDYGELKEISLLAGRPTVSDLFLAVAAADLHGARRRMGALLRGIHGMIRSTSSSCGECVAGRPVSQVEVT